MGRTSSLATRRNVLGITVPVRLDEGVRGCGHCAREPGETGGSPRCSEEKSRPRLGGALRPPKRSATSATCNGACAGLAELTFRLRRMFFSASTTGQDWGSRVTCALVALAIASCEPPVTAVRTTAANGDEYIIGCEESPRFCKEKARELCPFGETTLRAGVGGWYSQGQDFRKSHGPRNGRDLFKLEGWTIRCNQPLIGR
jgi:hypothetical protein